VVQALEEGSSFRISWFRSCGGLYVVNVGERRAIASGEEAVRLAVDDHLTPRPTTKHEAIQPHTIIIIARSFGGER
jgi:hypothetical protein